MRRPSDDDDGHGHLLVCGRRAEEETPQCFLLTPKLLPDLPYSQHVSVLQIMNGTQISAVAPAFTNVRPLLLL